MDMTVTVLLARSQPSAGGLSHSFFRDTLDLILSARLKQGFVADSRSRNSSLSGDERGSPSRYHAEARKLLFSGALFSELVSKFQDNRPGFIDTRVQPKPIDQWPEQDAAQGMYNNEVSNHIEVRGMFPNCLA